MDRAKKNNPTGEIGRIAGSRLSRGIRAVRTGTVLILVLGVLALLAVITAVYVSIGQADRRTGETVKRSKAIDEAADRVADHISNIVGTDALATMFEHSQLKPQMNMPAALRREAFDYPYTDYSARSIFPFAQRLQRDGLRFDPAGSFSIAWPVSGYAAASPDPRRPSDPFLAATEPTYLSPDGNDDLSVSGRERYLNNRDWAHISNISPDGSFVNLYNLRPNNGTSPSIGFDARPWDMRGVTSMGAKSSTASPLTFLDRHTDPERAPITTATPFFGVHTDYSADWQNRPAFFSNAQRYAFRPMDIAGLDWKDPDFIRYQWADADGDGFADARWQELIDATDPQSLVDLMPGGEYRWFVAARIIDLSGLVNVNTAGDFLSPGTAALPTGLTPGEVDLRRLLMMTDATDDALQTFQAYGGLRNPASMGATTDDSNYNQYYDSGTGNQNRAAKAGLTAYGALRKAIYNGVAPPAGFDLATDPIQPYLSMADTGTGFNWLSGPFGNLPRLISTSVQSPPINPFARMMAYQEAAAAAQRGEFERGGARGFFGSSDLAELLSFRTANDDSRLSRLEQTLDGRILINDPVAGSSGAFAYDGLPITTRFGPLRSTRDEEYERRGRSLAEFNENLSRGANQRALRQAAYDVRQRLTSASGSRPIASRTIEKPAYPSLNPNVLNGEVELRLDAPSLLGEAMFAPDAGLRQTAVRHIFKGYLDSLAPLLAEFSPTPGALYVDWRPKTGNSWIRQTLAYGYDGPELAFNLAAQMTVNLIDAFDDDQIPSTTYPPVFKTTQDNPTVMTVILDQDLMNLNLAPTPGYLMKDPKPAAQRQYPFAASGDGYRLPPEELTTLDPTNASQVLVEQEKEMRRKLRLIGSGQTATMGLYSPAKNVYGMEAFPIITEAVSFFVYADSPSGSADITEVDGLGNTTIFPTIDGSLDASNGDLVMNAVAFQIHNPFDKEIQLTAADSGVTEFLYYLQFGGRTYKLCDLQGGAEIAVNLQPGETRWFYYVNDLDTYESRFRSLVGASGSTTYLTSLIGKQLKASSAVNGAKLARMVQLDPITGATVSMLAGTSPKLISDDKEENRVVRLWRAMRLGKVGDPSGVGDAPGLAANAVENDMLVDRLRDPSLKSGSGVIGDEPILAKRLDESVVKVLDPSIGDEDTQLTLMFMNAVKRPDESGSTPVGGLPAYMLERSSRTGGATGATIENIQGYNDDFDRKLLTDKLEASQFDPDVHAAAKSTVDFSARFIEPDPNATPNTLRYALENRFLGKPDTRHADPIGNTLDGRSLDAVRASYYLANNRLLTKVNNLGPSGDGQEFADQIVPGVLRVGDLLSQLAIGAQFDPWRGAASDYSGELNTDRPRTALSAATTAKRIVTNAWDAAKPNGGGTDLNLVSPDDPRWMTFGEALAIALNYDTGRDVAPGGIRNPYYRLGGTDRSTYWPKLDRGTLVLDDYTPYENRSGTGVIKYDAPDPANWQASKDRIRGLGVPVALNILNNFRTLGRYRVADIIGSDLRLSRDLMGDVDKVVPGLININTAPLAVLRTLPMLSPTLGNDPLSTGTSAEWWGAATSGSDLDSPLGVTTRDSDIAARIVAYRDKLWEQRPRDPNSTAVFNYGNQPAIIDGYGGGLGRYTALNPTGGTLPRELVVREQPGFQSLGEVMLATNRDRSLVDPAQIADESSMDFLGRDKTSGGQLRTIGSVVKADPMGKNLVLGLPSRVYATPASPTVRETTSEVANSMDERLAIFNAIGNSISVSSDYYACWFVLHGYKRTDVEPLRDGDPLVPSVARRYLMVLDRSNVTKVGDRPRVVVFKELPLQ